MDSTSTGAVAISEDSSRYHYMAAMVSAVNPSFLMKPGMKDGSPWVMCKGTIEGICEEVVKFMELLVTITEIEEYGGSLKSFRGYLFNCAFRLRKEYYAFFAINEINPEELIGSEFERVRKAFNGFNEFLTDIFDVAGHQINERKDINFDKIGDTITDHCWAVRELMDA